ncbi:2-polyprenyl-6-methoxyphenol hydroxylase-like FAD-dependent oxidoreductase [Pedobacter cryoconitis]|uniref:2-polyprenyl-6-methoxyphenol hydroxylase-like FAD-dependent oxidoreductase n=2 Tax=Pedobacter cryoconitis TaxID=188932 RepID=A0A327T6Q1_9SPHI|nr:2-polyprenyl-6-methoxyphenol hydroxylase-like FAD-dependent oxidoreductase [Pedobacter cryoconitis]
MILSHLYKPDTSAFQNFVSQSFDMKTILESNKSAPQYAIYDVIISGAGPVGLFLACELALAKCSVLILEKTEHPDSPLKQLPFGIRGLSAPTIESLYRRNLLQELELYKHIKNPHKTSAPVQGPRRQGGHFAGIPFLDGNIDTSQWKYRLASATDTSLISEMQELENVLNRRAESLGVEIRRGLAITGFHQTANEVTVQSGEQSFQCRWLVGCDGSRSVVRKAGGFEFAGTEPEFTGYTTQIDIADPEKLSPGRNVTSLGMYMQSQPGYVLIQDFDAGAFHHSQKPVTLEHVQEVLRRVSNTDVTINALHMATTWTDRARQATTYRNGRVLLAGDAAHIHSPLGGQGLNLGLGDAMNLGWKLAATIQNKAPEGLLDSYYTERHPIGAQVLDWSRAQVAIMNPSPQARALQAIIRDLMDTRDGATYFAGRVWGLSTHYDLGSDHPLTGYSVPNFEFEDGTTIGGLMHDGQGILLDFKKNTSLQTLAGKYSDRIKYISAGAKDQLALSAVLIRPDGIIAWVADNDPDYSEFQKAAGCWFISDSGIQH